METIRPLATTIKAELRAARLTLCKTVEPAKLLPLEAERQDMPEPWVVKAGLANLGFAAHKTVLE